MKHTRSNYDLSQTLKCASPRLRKAIIENWENDLVLGIVELALNVLNRNSKISRYGADMLRKHKIVLQRLDGRGIVMGKKRKLII